jgi:hypothetical protein
MDRITSNSYTQLAQRKIAALLNSEIVENPPSSIPDTSSLDINNK